METLRTENTEPITPAPRPFVSIGMPVYNEERYLAATLDAILAQDYTNFELIISDNASTDETPRICQAYAARDPRIRYVPNERNVGAFRNFNKVFELSRGEFFAWAGGHDLWQPQFVSLCLQPLLDDETVVLVHPRTIFLGPENQWVGNSAGRLDTRDHLQRLSRFNIVLWSLGKCFEVYGLMRSSALRQTHLLADTYAPDYVLLLELAFLGTFAHIPEPVLHARQPNADKEASLRKYFGRTLSRFEALNLYRKFLFHNLGTVIKHARSVRGKIVGVLMILMCACTKDSWMLKILWTYSPARPARSRVTRGRFRRSDARIATEEPSIAD